VRYGKTLGLAEERGGTGDHKGAALISFINLRFSPVATGGILSIIPTGVYKEKKPYFSPRKTWFY